VSRIDSPARRARLGKRDPGDPVRIGPAVADHQISLGPAIMSCRRRRTRVASRPPRRRCPGPTILSTAGTVSVPYASAATACAPRSRTRGDTPARPQPRAPAGCACPSGVGTTITIFSTPATCAAARSSAATRVSRAARRARRADAVERVHALAQLGAVLLGIAPVVATWRSCTCGCARRRFEGRHAARSAARRARLHSAPGSRSSATRMRACGRSGSCTPAAARRARPDLVDGSRPRPVRSRDRPPCRRRRGRRTAA